MKSLLHYENLCDDPPSTLEEAAVERRLSHLSQRDRALIALVIRRYIASDIRKHGREELYRPAVLSVPAFELLEFADELSNCCNGDSVELASQAAEDIDNARANSAGEDGVDILGPDDVRSQDALALIDDEPELARFAKFTREDYDFECQKLNS